MQVTVGRKEHGWTFHRSGDVEKSEVMILVEHAAVLRQRSRVSFKVEVSGKGGI